MRPWLCLLAALSLVGCDPAAPPPPELPVGVLDKRLFEGDHGWYYQKTFIEMPLNVDGSKVDQPFVSPTSPLRKIRWELQESFLVAYRYEQGFTGETDSEGIARVAQPEMAFPCQHVDVFLDQVAVTASRSWWERSHVIVDWAHPALEGTRYLDLPPGALRPERFWVSDPTDRDAPIFSDGYLDVVVRGTLAYAYLKPYGFDSEFWCGDRDNPNCTGGRVSYRLSFLRAEPSDYEPLPVRDVMAVNTFPVFKTAQVHFSDQYGFTDGAKTSLAFRFNIWERTRADDGSLIPVRERRLRQRAVFLSPNWPEELIPEVRRSLSSWNEALRDAVNSRRRLDCARQSCAPQLELGWEYLVLCPNNPSREGDPEVCGPPGTFARLGDVRRFFLLWNDAVAFSQPIAFAYWAADPQTGELLGGQVIVDAAMLDRQAMTLVDAVRLLNGDAAFRQSYASGAATQSWVEKNRSLFGTGDSVVDRGDALAAEWGKAATSPPFEPEAPLGAEERARRAALPRWGWLNDPAAAKGIPDARLAEVALTERSARTLERLRLEATLGDARRRALWGTAFEAALLDEEALLRAGVDPAEALSDEKLDELSPLRSWSWWRRTPTPYDSFAADSFFSDPDVSDIAPLYRGMPDLELFKEIRKQQVHMVMIHELGHVFGLRHNFGGSYDPFNYPDQYWALRSDGAMGPRFQDPLTAAERAGGIRKLGYSSVMDYFPGPHVWSRELGRYDRAVLKWLYGGVVEVLDGPKNRANAASLNQLIYWYRFYAPTPMIPAPDSTKRSLHYTDLPRYFDLANRVDFPVEELTNFYDNPERIPGTGATATPDGRVMVPYHSCSDEAPPVIGCARQDLGADPYEVVTDLAQRERGYYLYSHFRRGFVGFPALRKTGFDDLALSAQSALTLSASITGLLVNDATLFQAGEGLEVYSQALVASLDSLGEKLTMPNVGSYELRPDAEGRPLYQQSPGGTLRLDYDVGRYYSSAIMRSTDDTHDWLSEISRRGFAGDKYDAVDVMAYGPNVSGQLGLNDVGNPRRTVAGYYNFFPAELNDFFGAVLSDDIQRTAPAWDGTQLVRPRISDPSWSAGGQPQVDPMLTLSTKLRLLTDGYPSLIASSADRSFADLARVWVAGSGAAITTASKVSFVDPFSGKTYEAISVLDGNGEERGIGARMLERADRLLTRSLTASTQAEREEAARALEELRYLLEYARLVVENVERGGP